MSAHAQLEAVACSDARAKPSPVPAQLEHEGRYLIQERSMAHNGTSLQRADKLVQLAAKQKGVSHLALDAIVTLIDRRLEANRKMKPATG
jgi:hypothetical protein